MKVNKVLTRSIRVKMLQLKNKVRKLTIIFVKENTPPSELNIFCRAYKVAFVNVFWTEVAIRLNIQRTF